MSYYIYDKSPSSGNFPNGFELTFFRRNVERALDKVEDMRVKGDEVTIYTSSALTTQEESDLDDLVTGFVPGTTPDSDMIMELAINNTRTKNTGYSRITSTNYPGDQYLKLDRIIVRTWISTKRGETYNIRFANIDTGDVISEITGLANSTEQTFEFTGSSIANVPTTNANIELTVASPSKKWVYTEHAALYLSER